MLKLRFAEEKKGKEAKIRLGFYPYTYVRTTVMRTLLLEKSHYGKLLKMDFNEIAQFLQETTYKKEIDRFATSFKGADLIERALNANLGASFQKLRRISSEEIRLVVESYIKRRDIEDIKTILRGKFTNVEQKIIADSLVGAGTLSMDYLFKLIKIESVEEILKNLEKIGLEMPKDKNNLAEVENALDKNYYQNMLNLSKRLSRQGKLLREFLVTEIKVVNLLTLLRFKKAKADVNGINSYIIYFNDKRYDNFLKNAIKEKIENIFLILQKTEFKNAIQSGVEEYNKTGSLIEIETSLYKFLLNKSILLLHQHPLSIDVILGYMFAKDLEVRNLKILVKGKQLGISNEFLEKQLIIA